MKNIDKFEASVRKDFDDELSNTIMDVETNFYKYMTPEIVSEVRRDISIRESEIDIYKSRKDIFGKIGLVSVFGLVLFSFTQLSLAYFIILGVFSLSILVSGLFLLKYSKEILRNKGYILRCKDDITKFNEYTYGR